MSALTDFQAAYAANAAKIAEIVSNPAVSYTVDNVHLDWGQYHDRLLTIEERLRKIPGVVPNIFEIHADPSWCG